MAAESITVDNPYGIQAMWAQGDYVTKGVLVLLVLMSAYSWFIIFTKWWEQKRLLGQAKEAEKNFWAADNIKNGVTELSGKGNVFKAVASEAIDAGYWQSATSEAAPSHRSCCSVRIRAVSRASISSVKRWTRARSTRG